ncbi:hypothetical protein [uncultured Hoeflea sp.]|uniref:hypothetical protein n=1 Tax=uncultured Hoeflea sp. TaxID=538666 RepID=UPI0030DCFE9A
MTARLTIITNHPARAVLAVLGVETAPAWLAIVTTLEGVRALPAGAKVIGQWFEPRKHRSALEWAFQTRRLQGDLIGLSLEDCDRLAAWAARHCAHATLDSSLAAATNGMVISERRIS